MKWLAYRYLRLRGWAFLGMLPDVSKMIVIGAPHTTNWDFVAYLAALHHFRFRASYIGKHTLFRWPFGYLFRYLGGIPVGGSKPGSIVGQVTDAFNTADEMALVISPEGARKSVPYWKSGFLKIAEMADVPVLLAAVDFAKRELTIGPLIDYAGDASAFMEEVRSFYDDKVGLHPDGKGPVRVRQEASESS
ncbi:MAG: glycerol acyltransferase [Acidobacteria bacterium]|nr:glycerol acyltransferase [Acidobacteriota bacterium]